MSAYKIVSAVIPERVDDSQSDRYLVVAPEDKIVWVTTSEPQDLTPEGRKRAVHQAGIISLLRKMKREENAVESDDYDSEKKDGHYPADCNSGSDEQDEGLNEDEQELVSLYLDTEEMEQN